MTAEKTAILGLIESLVLTERLISRLDERDRASLSDTNAAAIRELKDGTYDLRARIVVSLEAL